MGLIFKSFFCESNFMFLPLHSLLFVRKGYFEICKNTEKKISHSDIYQRIKHCFILIKFLSL